MYFLTVVVKNLLRRKVRSILTGIGVAVAVCAMVALVGITDGFERSALAAFQKRGADIIVVAAGIPNQLGSELDETIAERIKEIPGVRLVTGGLIELLSLQGPDSSLYIFVQGWQVDNPAFGDLEILEGRRFNAGEKGVCLLGANAASALKKKVGDLISIKHEKFRVLGLFRSFTVYENDSCVVELKELQRIMGRKGSVTGFSVALQESSDKEISVKAIAATINALTDKKGHSFGLSALPTAQYVSQSAHIKMSHAMAWITATIALVIGAISVANTMAMSVMERTREIGILLAIGWRKSRIVRMILIESFLVSSGGGVVGAVGGVIVCHWCTRLPQVGGFIQGDVSFVVVAEGIIMALLVGIVGGIWPAVRAARLLPMEALYHE